MVRSYDRFEAAQTFGVICSNNSNALVCFDSAVKTVSGPVSAGRAVVPALEDILTWDIKKGEICARWHDDDCRAEVTQIARTDAQNFFAAGYSDGSVRIWDAATDSLRVVLNGHRTAITALSFDGPGIRLASGSRDTNIVLWDVVAEVGIARLKGHSDQITGLQFVAPEPISLASGSGATHLISTAKDGLIKVWNLDVADCIETHTAHTGECWALASFAPYVVTAGLDGELKLWRLDHHADLETEKPVISSLGSVNRQSRTRPQTLAFNADGHYLAAHGTDKSVELFRLRSELEIEKLKKRRRKRKAKEGDEQDLKDDASCLDAADRLVSYVTIRANARVRSVAWLDSPDNSQIRLFAALSNNSLETFTVPVAEALDHKNDVPDYQTSYALQLPGHQSEIRCGALNGAADVFASVSDGQLKLWNVSSGTCIRTLACGSATSLSWMLSDRYIVVATKEGELELFDVAAASLVESVAAHEGVVSSLHLHPDGTSIASGSADKTVKFWKIETRQKPVLGTTRTTNQITLKQSRTLKLTDDVLAIRFSPDGKLLAVSLLDNTVKVFFADTLKFYLSLYGHKLPVLDMDIAQDNKLLVTSSADKNVKLWGLDFGDCHKSIFAHSDAVLRVKFQRTYGSQSNDGDNSGHNFFSCSRDRQIRYWDGDRFESILRLDGHHAEVSALDVGPDFVVTGGHDRSIRVWRMSDDPVFLEEEREKELETMYEDQLTDQLRRQEILENAADGPGEADDVVEAANASTAVSGHTTIESLTASEKIAESLDIGESDLLLMREYEREKLARPALGQPQRHPILVALGNIASERHVLNTVRGVKASQIEAALLVLPFDRIITLLRFCDIWAQNGWDIALTTRIIVFLLRNFHQQIVANRLMRSMLDSVRGHLRLALNRERDLLGYNLAALRFVKQEMRYDGVTEFADVQEPSKKRAFATIL
ncbi:beta transducin [Savitreella phatthalungensis]